MNSRLLFVLLTLCSIAAQSADEKKQPPTATAAKPAGGKPAPAKPVEAPKPAPAKPAPPPPPKPVSIFPDKALEAAVRSQVFAKRENQEPITAADVETVSVIEGREMGIKDLTGL